MVANDMDVADDPVVIVGMSGQFPNSDNVEQFENNLFDGVHLVREHADKNWQNTGKYTVPNMVGKMKSYTKFDNMFFGITHKQASSMDPLTRVMMENVFEAVIDAGFNPSDLRGRDIGVFMGSTHSESEATFITHGQNGFGILGHNRTMIANRVSYWLGTHGPSFTVLSGETCGIQCLEMAYEAVKKGRCEAAITGTVNIIMHPDLSHQFQLLNLLCDDGKTKSFDAAADGYARSEACVALLVTRASRAKRIYGVIEHATARCYNNRKERFTAVNSDLMIDLLRKFYEECGVDPASVDYLEGAGSGLRGYDKAELLAVQEVMLRGRRTPLLLGSVKSNMGHAETASDMCALVKLLLSIRAGAVPGNLHYSEPNPDVPALTDGRIKVVTETTPLNGRLLALNSLGIGGLYGHALVRAYVKPRPPPSGCIMRRLVPVSSRTEAGLEALLSKLNNMTPDEEYIRLLHDIHNNNITNHSYRGYTVVPPCEEKPLTEVEVFDGARRPVWFVFSGMGSQWPTMGVSLMQLPVFAATIHKCHKLLLPRGVDLLRILTDPDPTIFDNILNSFVGIAAVQMGLVDVLSAVGIRPDGIIGHSVGELGCAYADGCLTAEQMILAAYSRGKASVETEVIIGSMAAIGLGYTSVKDLCPPSIDVACHNSADSCTISGPRDDVHQFVADLKGKGVFARAVNVANIAYHSRYIKGMAPALLRYMQEVVPDPIPRTQRWVSTSVPEHQWDSQLAKFSSAEYHTNNLLSPVLFEETSRHIPKNAIAIEIAPHGLLQAILRRSLDSSIRNIPLTQRGNENGLDFLLAALGKMFVAGMHPRVATLYPPVALPVSTATPSLSPIVSWDHSETWVVASDFNLRGEVKGEENILVSLNQEESRILISHKINNKIYYPLAAYLKLAWDILAKLKRTTISNLPVIFEDVRVFEELEIPDKGSVYLCVFLQCGSGHFEVTRVNSVLVSGTLRPYQPLPRETRPELPSPRGPFCRLSGAEVYRLLEQRGHQYGSHFREVQWLDAGEQGSTASVQWSNNWVTFIQSLLQLSVLKAEEGNQELRLPVSIQEMIVEPAAHTAPQQEFLAVTQDATQSIQCGGVRMKTARTRAAPHDLVSCSIQDAEISKFVSHDADGIKDAEQLVDFAVQLALENLSLENEEDSATMLQLTGPEGADSLLGEMAARALADFARVTVRTQTVILNGPQTTLDVANVFLVLAAAQDLPKAIAALGSAGGFVLTRGVGAAVRGAVEVVAVGGLKLLRVPSKLATCTPELVPLMGDCISWLEQVKVACSGGKQLVAVSRGSLPRDVCKLVGELQHKPESRSTRCMFIVDPTAPPFNLENDFYRNQLRQDLLVNVYNDGSWGSFRELPCNREARLLPAVSLEGVELAYEGLNLLDVTVTERATTTDTAQLAATGLGAVEYAGILAGRRVMGLSRRGVERADPERLLTWDVPEHWSLDDAATVPFAFATAYHCLVLVARVESGESVLIHAGHTPLGQAAIAVALSLGCRVFTSVPGPEEEAMLRARFPGLQDVVSFERDFETRLLLATAGDGVNVILNCLEGSKMNATRRCLASFGRFVQLGRADLVRNNSIGLYMFLQSTAFFGVAADNLFNAPAEWKERLHTLVQEGVRADVVRPLPHKVFPDTEAPAALTMLANNVTSQKMVISYTKTSKKTFNANAPSGERAVKLRCQENESYVVAGRCAEDALDLAEWLVCRGARRLSVSLGTATNDYALYRAELLRRYYGATVELCEAREVVSCAQRLAPLAGAFLVGLPREAARQLEQATRPHLLALLLCEGGEALSEGRRAARLPAVALDGHVSLRRALVCLDRALAHTAVVVSHERGEEDRSKMLADLAKLSGMLPVTAEALDGVGGDLLGDTEPLLEVPTLSRPLRYAVEEPTLFVVPGLQDAPARLLQPLTRHLMYPTLCARPGAMPGSLSEAARVLADKIRAVQPEGPYNVLGVSWGGALAVELARELQAEGHKTHVMLLDAAPETMRTVAEQLGRGSELGANLLARLFSFSRGNLTLKAWEGKVQAELAGLSEWDAQLQRVLALLDAPEERRERWEAAATAVHRGLTALLEHTPPSNELLEGAVTLIRPLGSSDQDNGGLDKLFRQTARIQLAGGDHRGVLSDKATAEVINDTALAAV